MHFKRREAAKVWGNQHLRGKATEVQRVPVPGGGSFVETACHLLVDSGMTRWRRSPHTDVNDMLHATCYVLHASQRLRLHHSDHSPILDVYDVEHHIAVVTSRRRLSAFDPTRKGRKTNPPPSTRRSGGNYSSGNIPQIKLGCFFKG
ncbi:hypothetical protein EYF80_043411 [Liparis tanakae]|uniref:Uncharacterized protein n=1 Tax=Liparis tanakae TaxID=230148 RepID=A0A4Z2FYK1_9TELE|nr:hypothetical protein EYF80_043411 [Liparis tanakae]